MVMIMACSYSGGFGVVDHDWLTFWNCLARIVEVPVTGLSSPSSLLLSNKIFRAKITFCQCQQASSRVVDALAVFVWGPTVPCRTAQPKVTPVTHSSPAALRLQVLFDCWPATPQRKPASACRLGAVSEFALYSCINNNSTELAYFLEYLRQSPKFRPLYFPSQHH